MVSSFLNAAGTIGRVTINERIEVGRRERRVLARVARTAWRREGRTGTDVGAGLGSRGGDLDPHAGRGGRAVTLAGAPARGRCRLGCAGRGAGELRAASWPAPRIQAQGRHRTRRPGHHADRLPDEVSWLRQCADWLTHLDADSYPHSRLPPRLPPMWAPVKARPLRSPALTPAPLSHA